jgi:hypothetical protein
MSSAFGLVRGEQLNIANSFGSIAKGAGYSLAESAQFANTLLQITANFSSFKNLTLAEASGKVQGFLAGESRGMREFGLIITEAEVKAEAARLGFRALGGELADTALIAARASLLQKGLADAGGDLERTAGDTANQFRQLKGGILNAAESLGTLLYPAINAAVRALNEGLTAAVNFASTGGSALASFAASVENAFKTAGLVIRNFDLVWDIAVLGVKQAAGNIGAYIATIPANLRILGNYVATNFVKLLADGLNAALSIFKNFAANATGLFTAIGTFFGDPTRGFEFKWRPLLEGFKATADSLPELVKPALNSLQGEIDKKAAEITARELKRGQEARAKVNAGTLPTPAAGLAAAASGAPSKLASALEFGTKEAYSAIVKAQGGKLEGKGIEDVAKAAVKQVGFQNQMVNSLKNIEGYLSNASGPTVFSFPS